MPRLLVIALVLAACVPCLARPRQQGDQVRLGTDLVEVRAVVTDADGNPILGLGKDDFEVLDGGVAQSLRFFSVERVPRPDATAGVTSKTADPTALPPVRTVVLFVDDLHLSPLSLANLRVAMKTFVATSVSDRDLLGIVTVSGRVRLFGQFGADRSVLDAAIDAIPLGPRDWWPEQFTPLLSGLIRQAPGDESPAVAYGGYLLKQQENVGASDPYEASAVDRSYREKAKLTAREVLLQVAARRTASLDALKILCDQLADLPGQRLVIAFSDGFSLRDFDGFSNGDELRVVASHAARAGVVVNEVIATGLDAHTGMQADQRYAPSPFGLEMARSSSRDLENGAAGIAKATGGELFADSNDLVGRAREVLERNDGYYALAYYAPDPGGKAFRAVEVRVRNHPDYTVRAHGGYLPFETRAKRPGASTDTTTRLADSVLSPDVPRQLDVSLQLAAVEANEKRSIVTLAARVGSEGVSLEELGGRFKVSLDVATAVFDLSGKLVFVSSDHIGGSLSPEDAEKASEAGFRYTAKTDPLPPGIYQARFAVLDGSTGRLGARVIWLKVPISKS